MTENLTLIAAVEQWQRKHGLSKDDPAIAVLELIQIHMEELQQQSPNDTAPTTFEECRGSIEDLTKASKEFSSMGRDLLQEIRQRIPAKQSKGNSRGIGWALVGIAIGVALGAAFGYLSANGEIGL